MKVNVELDGDLVDEVRGIIGDRRDLNEVVQQAVRQYLPMLEAIEGLIALGGSMPDLEDVPRRRSEPA